MIENKILQFEPFKKAKKWDDEYIEFLGNIEKYFKTKTNPFINGWNIFRQKSSKYSYY